MGWIEGVGCWVLGCAYQVLLESGEPHSKRPILASVADREKLSSSSSLPLCEIVLIVEVDGGHEVVVVQAELLEVSSFIAQYVSVQVFCHV